MQARGRLGPFRRLRWQLALSHLLSTVAAVAVIGVICYATIGYDAIQYRLHPELVVRDAEAAAPEISRYLDAPRVDRKKLRKALHKAIGEDASLTPEPGRFFRFALDITTTPWASVAIADRNGVVIEGAPTDDWRQDEALSTQISASEATLVRSAMRGKTASMRTAAGDGSGIVLATPVFGKTGNALGTIFVRFAVPFGLTDYLIGLFLLMLPMVANAAFFGGIVSTISGFFMARRLTSRLGKITAAADLWSCGEFAASAADHSDDELGRLAQHLDLMASQLEEHCALQQQLASTEARNKLARDLHDTVKQQVFAAAMHIGAARSKLDAQSAAQPHIDEAANLIQAVQRDLSTILDELNPLPSEWRTSLNSYLTEWSRQTRINVVRHLEGTPNLPEAQEEAILRIVQGALSNVARHSKADSVTIEVKPEHKNRIVVSIADNGQGFDVSPMTWGSGLRIMQERAEELPEGEFSITSRLDRGTRVEVRCSTEEAQP